MDSLSFVYETFLSFYFDFVIGWKKRKDNLMQVAEIQEGLVILIKIIWTWESRKN